MGDTSLLVTRDVISHYDSMSLRLRDCRGRILGAFCAGWQGAWIWFI